MVTLRSWITQSVLRRAPKFVTMRSRLLPAISNQSFVTRSADGHRAELRVGVPCFPLGLLRTPPRGCAVPVQGSPVKQTSLSASILSLPSRPSARGRLMRDSSG